MYEQYTAVLTVHFYCRQQYIGCIEEACYKPKPHDKETLEHGGEVGM